MIQELSVWLAQQTGWKLGKSLFVGHLPVKDKDGLDVPERCALLLERVPAAVNGQLPDRQDKPIQLWNRARSYFTARADAELVFTLLHGMDNLSLPVLTSGEEHLAMVVDAMASPAPIANPDAKGLFQFSTNYMFRLEDPNA
jgi:hypothetical protein